MRSERQRKDEKKEVKTGEDYLLQRNKHDGPEQLSVNKLPPPWARIFCRRSGHRTEKQSCTRYDETRNISPHVIRSTRDVDRRRFPKK